MATRQLAQNLRDWIQVRTRFHLLHAHVQMARELGMNPKKLGKLDNHRQKPWKAPLPEFIEHLYVKRFGRERPEGFPNEVSRHVTRGWAQEFAQQLFKTPSRHRRRAR